MTASEKTKILRPHWKYFFLSYLYSILLIPVFGIGLVALWFVWNKHKQYEYRISDHGLTIIDKEYERKVDLAEIQGLRLERDWLRKKLGVGSIVLKLEDTEAYLLGIENPEPVYDALETAIAALQRQQEQQGKQKPNKPEHKPGSMDRMNELTGMWQQGLISDEDFENERRHFE